MEDLKDLLRDNYEVIKNVFKMYSSISIEVFTMGYDALNELMDDTDLCSKFTRGEVSSILTMCVKTGEPHQRLNPPKSLTRPQFIDCLIRLSMLKFRELGDANSGAIRNTEMQRSPADATEIILMQVGRLATPPPH